MDSVIFQLFPDYEIPWLFQEVQESGSGLSRASMAEGAGKASQPRAPHTQAQAVAAERRQQVSERYVTKLDRSLGVRRDGHEVTKGGQTLAGKGEAGSVIQHGARTILAIQRWNKGSLAPETHPGL